MRQKELICCHNVAITLDTIKPIVTLVIMMIGLS